MIKAFLTRSEKGSVITTGPFLFLPAEITSPIMKGIELVERKRNFKVTEAIEREDRRGKYRTLYFFDDVKGSVITTGPFLFARGNYKHFYGTNKVTIY